MNSLKEFCKQISQLSTADIEQFLGNENLLKKWVNLYDHAVLFQSDKADEIKLSEKIWKKIKKQFPEHPGVLFLNREFTRTHVTHIECLFLCRLHKDLASFCKALDEVCTRDELGLMLIDNNVMDKWFSLHRASKNPKDLAKSKEIFNLLCQFVKPSEQLDELRRRFDEADREAAKALFSINNANDTSLKLSPQTGINPTDNNEQAFELNNTFPYHPSSAVETGQIKPDISLYTRSQMLFQSQSLSSDTNNTSSKSSPQTETKPDSDIDCYVTAIKMACQAYKNY